jgi:cobalt/nickel transport system permease protein
MSGMVPLWLKEKPAPDAPDRFGVSGRRPSKGRFLAKTLKAVERFFTENILLEKDAARDGALQRLDPRIKLVGLAAMLIAISLSRNPAPLVVTYTGTLTLAVASRLRLRQFLARTVIPAMIFALVLVLPATLNILTPGPSVLILAGGLSVTSTGLFLAGLFFLRALAMISVTTLVLRTTRADRLFNALADLKAPGLAVAILQMAYRYIFTLAELIGDLHMARKSRTIKFDSNSGERRWVAGRIGWTLNRSLELSEQVTESMISRGWNGKYISLPGPAAKRRDWLAAGIVLVSAAGLLALNIL